MKHYKTKSSGKGGRVLRKRLSLFFRTIGKGLAQAGDWLWRQMKNAVTGIRAALALEKEKQRIGRERRRGRPATLLQVMVANHESGHRFFSADVMAHYGTRLESRLLDGGFFVTSEKDGTFRPLYNRAVSPLAEARNYTVRRFDYKTGSIEDASALGEYHTREDALAAALELSRNV